MVIPTMESIKLVDSKLVKNEDNQCGLNLTYVFNRGEDLLRLNIPFIGLPIENLKCIDIENAFFNESEVYADFHYLRLPISLVSRNAKDLFTITPIEKTMTISEIEEELGYKIKIKGRKYIHGTKKNN